jgi:hypothetical protein
MFALTIASRLSRDTTSKIWAKSSFKIINMSSKVYSFCNKFVNVRCTNVKQCLYCIDISFQMINFVRCKNSYKCVLRMILQIVSFVICSEILKRKCDVWSSNNNKVAMFDEVTHMTISFQARKWWQSVRYKKILFVFANSCTKKWTFCEFCSTIAMIVLKQCN